MAGSTLVLVLTDVAGSTRLWAEHPAAMLAVMRRHHRIVHDAIDAHDGRRPIDQGEGDAVFAAFTSAPAAVEAVLAFQRALEEEPWPEGIVLRARVGIHAGEVVEQDGNLFGVAVSRTARIRSLGSGGQVLVSDAVLELVGDRLPPGTAVTDLGTLVLRDLDLPEAIHQVVGPGMVATFPPLTLSVEREVVLPTPRSSFVGRAQEVGELSAALRSARLVTVTGFGGMGKTRLAVAVAAAVAEDDEQLGVRFVDLSAVDRADSIGPAIAGSLGIDEGIDDPLESVQRWLRGRRVLLVLDNLEQLMPEGSEVVARLLDASPDLRVLATSREPLRLLGEEVFALAPLATPPPAAGDQRVWTGDEVEALHGFAAVRLFMTRATAARRDLALTPSTAQAIAAICIRLEGSPLAMELVAVRLRTQSPPAVLARLEHALAAAAGGIRDLPARQQTLRATIEWSVRALDAGEQRLLWRLSVFPGTFTAEAAEVICAEQDPATDVLTGLLELVDRSLVRVHAADGIDTDRFDLLVPIREFAAERLADTEPDGTTPDRHADHFAHAVHLDPDGSRDDQAALAVFVEQDWHNVRAALDRLHDRGRVEDELELSPMLGRSLQHLGKEGAAILLLRHAVGHLEADDSGDAAIAVLLHLADLEFGADLGATAVATILRSLPLLERNRSPALRIHLTALDTMMQDPCGLGPDALDVTYDLLDVMRETGNPLPRWYVTDLWVQAAILVGDRRADRLQALLLDTSTGREHLRLRCAFGADLSWVGRAVEAEQLLAVFADAAVRRSAYPVDRILPLLVLADIRIAAGRASEAGPVLDAAATDIAAFDQPWEHVMIRVQRSAIDRALGDLDAAAERLQLLLSSEDAEGVEGATAFAAWLLAVVERERGRPGAAAVSLRRAWNIARAAPDELLKVRCLLERSVERLGSAPWAALRDLATATTHPAPEWVHFAVDYDTEALGHALESILGAAAVGAAMAEAAAHDLLLPAWDEVG